MLLDNGLDVERNVTIIPAPVIDTVTTARVVSLGKGSLRSPGTSLIGYGLGWGRLSYKGYDVCLTRTMLNAND